MTERKEEGREMGGKGREKERSLFSRSDQDEKNAKCNFSKQNKLGNFYAN